MAKRTNILLENRDTLKGAFFAVFTLSALLFFISCNQNEDFIPQFTSSNTGPYTIQIDHLRLIDSLKAEDPVLNTAYQELIHVADSILSVSFSPFFSYSLLLFL